MAYIDEAKDWPEFLSKVAKFRKCTYAKVRKVGYFSSESNAIESQAYFASIYHAIRKDNDEVTRLYFERQHSEEDDQRLADLRAAQIEITDTSPPLPVEEQLAELRIRVTTLEKQIKEANDKAQHN